jgi:pyridinium-3,5-biscarboxylic acid mononucleotide sulfurtransferase
MNALETKLEDLKKFISDKGGNGVVIAFSGGVDSATLAAISHQVLGEKAVAVIAQSPTYTADELHDAQKTARQIDIKLYVTLTKELENEEFAKNPENRCYFCKKELLQKLMSFALEHGFGAVFEGTNFSDLSDHRPGFRAVQEAEGVYSPWVACKFSKDEIRQVAKGLGLSVYDKPSLSCLASRIPFNEPITAEKLKRIEEAETAVREIVNVRQLRVRDHNGLARIEVDNRERELFLKADVMDRVSVRLKRLGFKFVTLDLEGYRSGSMLESLNESASRPVT